VPHPAAHHDHLAGIEKVLPRFQDLEVMLQVLARSATGERMNPYTSLWTGVTPGDGPQRFHVVLLDNGRSSILAAPTERQTLKCIRCAACMNACPVYRQTGGHAYGSVYPGPIGAILTPQLMQMHHAQSLPYASSLCGACYEVCPVKINIPEVLLELRSQVVNQERKPGRPLLRSHVPRPAHRQPALRQAWLFHAAQRLGRIGLRSSPARTDGFTRCPASAANGPRPAICAALPSQTFHELVGARAKEAK
jgi:L-lactate dehydrogenase complex protein LldF